MSALQGILTDTALSTITSSVLATYCVVGPIINSYSAIELVTIKDRSAAVTDRLLMNKAAGSFDITPYVVPETKDQIRLASVGAKALPVCFTGSIEVLQHLVMVVGLTAIPVYYHPLIAAIVFLPGDSSFLYADKGSGAYVCGPRL